jgi:hypothetical protein
MSLFHLDYNDETMADTEVASSLALAANSYTKTNANRRERDGEERMDIRSYGRHYVHTDRIIFELIIVRFQHPNNINSQQRPSVDN